MTRTVESVVPSKRAGSLKVSLSDGGYFYAKAESEAAAMLLPGTEIDDEALAKWRAHGGLTAEESAALVLGRRSCSEKELSDKLAEKGFAPSEIDGALAKMRDYGLVNDAEYAAEVVAMCAAKQRSKRHALEELRRRGIGRELAADAVEAGLGDQRTAAQELVLRKYGDIRALSREEKTKANNFLRSRGFDWQVISSVLRVYED